MSRLTVQHDKQLLKLFRTLPGKPARKVARQATNAAGTPVLKAMRQTVPEDTGTLKLALGKRTKTYADGVVVTVVGARRNIASEVAGKKRVPANYSHLVEAGHKGGARPTRFAARAYKTAEPAAISKSKAKLGQGIEREAKKLGNG